MLIKNIIDEDFINFKFPSMTIEMPFCTFKCDKECGINVCQNSALVKEPNIEILTEKLITRYLNNPITKAIVFQGLEPFDSWDELYKFCKIFRENSQDIIVIYTGYNKEEILMQIQQLSSLGNIIIKFGRFIPNRPHKFDEVLGVELASDNQYAKFI